MRKKRIFLLMIVASSCALFSPCLINSIQSNVTNELLFSNLNVKTSTNNLNLSTTSTTSSNTNTSSSSSSTNKILSNQQIVIDNVWSQSLGTIGFNTETKTLTLTKG